MALSNGWLRQQHFHFVVFTQDGAIVNRSILDAIRKGDWTYEPEKVPEDRFDSTSALPGTEEKVDEMAKRAKSGLPLWHSADRQTFDQSDNS